MASSWNERIIHKEKFQNANQMVEVLIRTKPKPKLPYSSAPVSKPGKFKRDCLLRKEIERLAGEQQGPHRPDAVQPQKKSNKSGEKKQTKDGHMVVEISKRNGHARKKKPASNDLDLTWKDILKNYSSINNDDSCSSGASNESGLDRIPSRDVLDRARPSPKKNKSVQTSKLLSDNPHPSSHIAGTSRRKYSQERSRQDKSKNGGISAATSCGVQTTSAANTEQISKQPSAVDNCHNSNRNVPVVNQVCDKLRLTLFISMLVCNSVVLNTSVCIKGNFINLLLE